MTRRFLATAQAQWPKPQPTFFVTSIDTDFKQYQKIEESRGLANRTLVRILSDYVSIKDYPKLGFSSVQPADTVAEAAFMRLINQGFKIDQPNSALSTQ